MLLGRSWDAPGIARTLQNRCSKGIRLQTRFYHHFGMALEAFLGGFLEPEMVLNPKTQKIEKPYETLRVRIEFEGQLIRKP